MGIRISDSNDSFYYLQLSDSVNRPTKCRFEKKLSGSTLAFAMITRSHTKDVNGNIVLYTAGDLAATMALNVDLKVLSANGYFDSVTPFSQTMTDLQNMPLTDATVRQNLTLKFYPSGHMVYLDGNSRTAMKADLKAFYDSTVSNRPAVARIRALQQVRRPK